MKKKVLFLCTGNSCRSQIAEAVTNSQRSDSWQAFSAGTKIADQTHPKAIAVLSEINIRHHGQPKPVSDFKDMDFDLVITVCGQADQNCPAWLGSGKKIHIGFDDPAAASGTETEIMDVFRRVRDEIIESILSSLDQQQN